MPRIPLLVLLPWLLAGALPAHADPAAASRYYEDALKRFERGDVAGTAVQLRNALQEEPRMLQALVLLGQTYLRQGNAAEAEKVLADAERLGAARAQIATLQAQALLGLGKSRELLEKFGADNLPAATRLEMLLLRTRAQLNLKQFDAALASAKLAAQLPGAESRALALQARAHLNAGRAEAARQAVQEALRMSPADSDALTMLGSILHSQGELSAAAQQYGLALNAQPKNLDARLARAGLLLDLKRDDAAKADLDYLQQHFAHDPRGVYLRALHYSRRGEEKKARAALQEVTRTLGGLTPAFLAGNDQLLLLGGLAHHSLGEFERAKTYLSNFLAQQPRHPGARKLLGGIYLLERDYSRASDMLQPVLLAQPGDATVLAMLGEAAMRIGNHTKAAMLFQEAAQAQDSASIQTGLGVSLIGAGQEAAGLQALARAHAKAPATTQAAVPYALALLQRGEAAKAVAVVDGVAQREADNVALRNLLGIARMAAGDRAGARAAYVKATQAAPSFYPAHLNLARLDEVENRIEAARRRYLGILKVAPSHLDAMLNLARLEEANGRPAQALQWLEQARSAHGRDLRPPLALHAYYLRQGQAKKALEAAKDAQGIAPDKAESLHALAQSQIALGNHAAARELLRRLVLALAFQPARLTLAAQLQTLINDLDGARYTLGKALTGDAHFIPALAQRVRVELRGGNLAEAEKQAQALAGQPGGGAEAQRLLGEIRLSQKRQAEAVSAYRKAYAQEAGAASAFGLYGALMAGAQFGEAAALMQEWHTRHPQDRAAAHALGEARLAQKDAARARAVYAELVRTDPKDARAHNNLALALLHLKEPAALQHAEQAYQLAPTQPQVNDTLGWVLVQQGQVDRGLRYLREAALRAPDDPEIQRHLEQTLAGKR